jgi:hypothetical protein
MERFCLACGLAVDEWVSEVGGGMGLRRDERAFKAELTGGDG